MGVRKGHSDPTFIKALVNGKVAPMDLYGALSVKRFSAAQSRPSSRRQVGRSQFF